MKQRTACTKIIKKSCFLICAFIFYAACFIPGTSLIPYAEARKTVNLVPENFSELAKTASPSVVNIRTVKTTKGGGRVFRHFYQSPFGQDDPFKDFFDKFFGDEQKEFKQRSLGSGFIIDKKGYIVTNNHVVENADEIQVRLKDGKQYDAEIVGRDSNTDIALIKINPEHELPVVELGNSEDLEVGQWVVAIGSPFGLEHTVTAGIVSAKGRVIGSGPYDDFIQTDASINPGNSGGPLLNLNGRVIGINTAIIAGGQGIGFAIPIDLAKGIIEQLKQSGEVIRGWLGVAIQDLSKELSEYYGIEQNQGILVTEVFPGDPAAKAGIRPEDIIIEINAKPITTSRELTRVIADAGVGDTVRIKVLRNSTEKTFDVKVAKREDSKLALKSLKQSQENELGIRVSEITPEIANRFNISESEGIIIIGIEPGSKGQEAGAQPGDIIREVNHTFIKTVDQYTEIIENIPEGNPVNMFIRRMNIGFLVIKMTK